MGSPVHTSGYQTWRRSGKQSVLEEAKALLSKILALQKNNACSPTILDVNLGPVVCNEIICGFFVACLETLTNKDGDAGMDLCNKTAVAVEPSGPCAARTTAIQSCMMTEYVAMQYLAL